MMNQSHGYTRSAPAGYESGSRISEWFVPDFGSARFRCFVGMLFLPYTGMVLSFTVLGSIIAPNVFWDRVAAIVIIYFCGLGIAAHALDALGSKGTKPWGTMFSRRHLWLMVAGSLAVAYSLTAYYSILYASFFWTIIAVESFFLFAYNLEWFSGKFHTDRWFGISWGGLPVVAGYMMQTNTIQVEALLLAVSMGVLSLVQIKASRPYKALKRQPFTDKGQKDLINTYAIILKSISLGIILLGTALFLWRLKG